MRRMVARTLIPLGMSSLSAEEQSLCISKFGSTVVNPHISDKNAPLLPASYTPRPPPTLKHELDHWSILSLWRGHFLSS